MARAWLINSRGIANKVKNCPSLIKDCEASRECPRCHYRISNSDVSTKWPGFPSGVKFDPSDAELIEHLAAKVGVGNKKPHMIIDEFIPTIDGDSGICYTHPENLPGAKKDGSSFHFFHKTSNAYSTGQRKRRKIDKEHDLAAQAVRWHKTGKTKAIKGGVYPGCKKIMVLYKSSNKGAKADKANWVMHQYHLGSTEDEKVGEYVVSKIFHQQPKQTDKNDHNLVIEESEPFLLQISPITPISRPPTTPAPQESAWPVADPDEYMHKSSTKVEEYVPGVFQYAQLQQLEDLSHVPELDSQFEDNMRQPTLFAGESQPDEFVPEVSQYAQLQQFKDRMSHATRLDSQFQDNMRQPTLLAGESQPDAHVPEGSQFAQLQQFEDKMSHPSQLHSQFEDNMVQPTWLAGESQPDEHYGSNCIDDSLLCKETFDVSTINGPVLNPTSNTDCANNTYGVTGNSSTPFGIPDLENLEFDSPPEFQLNDLPFYSQDSTWLDFLRK